MDAKTPRVKKSLFQPVAGRAEKQERCGCCSILHLHTAETESRLNTHSHGLIHTRSLAFSPPSQSITEGGGRVMLGAKGMSPKGEREHNRDGGRGETVKNHELSRR